jgi:hypothetical protein
MSISPSLPRMHAVALAIALLLVPTAVAKPIDENMRPSVAALAAEQSKQQPKQDLRSPDARDAVTNPVQQPKQDLRSPDAREPVTNPVQQPKQDLRSPDAREPVTNPVQQPKQDLRSPDARAPMAKPAPVALPGPPAMPVNPQPIDRTAPAAKGGDDGVDWGTIGIGVGLSLLAIGGITGLAHLLRGRRPARVAT